MENSFWMESPKILDGKVIQLLPLEAEHFDELEALAVNQRIWEFIPVDMSEGIKVRHALSLALQEREKGNQFPFVIYHKKDKRLIGSTRLMDIQAIHQKLEIGWTWLHPDYWASEVNPECKFLLLSYCFEQMRALRVQLKTDENNLRSRKAIAKIGGQFEGILRNDMLRANGTKRNSAYFSILDIEWDSVKSPLMERLQSK
jgi:RimJ/RimL family protein N-acetyltransferase